MTNTRVAETPPFIICEADMARRPNTPRQDTPRAARPKTAKAMSNMDKRLKAFHAELGPAKDNTKALANGAASPFGDDDPPWDQDGAEGPPSKKKRGGKKQYVPMEKMPPADPDAIMPSKLQPEFEAIIKMAETADSDTAAINLRLYKLLVKMLMNLIPIAESKYLTTRSEGAMYALSSALNNLKDLMDLIRVHSATDQRIDTLVSTVIAPVFMQIAQGMLAASLTAKGAIDSLKLKPEVNKAVKAAIDGMLRENATYLVAQQEMTVERVKAHFNPDLGPTAKPAAKKKAKAKKK